MVEPLLLLPGMMCDARLFAPQLAAFSAQRMVAVAPLVGHDDMAGLASEILLYAPKRFALAGLSMGGIVAMEVMRQSPDRVTRLALLGTNPLAEMPDHAAARQPQIDRVKAGHLRTVMRDEMKPSYLADGPNRDDILDLCMKMAETLGPDIFAAQSRALATRPDQTETLRAVRVPTLILCGADDLLCPPKRHTAMRDLVPGAHLAIIEGAGHLPVLEQPDRTNAELAAWLAR